jgi:dienelactone hydrolase
VETKQQMANGPFWATVSLSANVDHVERLEQEEDKNGTNYIDDYSNWIVTESDIVGDPRDSKWNIRTRPNIYIVSTKDGTRRLVARRLLYSNMSFSPSGRYLIWFDRQQSQWFSLNIIQNRKRKLTEGIKGSFDIKNDYPDLAGAPVIGGWLEDEGRVILYDRYDIWAVDPEGLKPPINITQSYGVKNQIKFRIMNLRNDDPFVIHHQDTLLLSAFDLRTKQEGFFQIAMASGNLDKLVMSSHIYAYQGDELPGAPTLVPVQKAVGANVYVLERMSPSDYPNLYITHNFENFEALTDFEPQRAYNWYTTELVHWRLPDQSPGEGILFKPENFDPKIKYPIIFFYYEKNAFNLNSFINPALSKGAIIIPWFVSNGYLVFVPDIYYKNGHPGQSAYNSVVSIALYFAKKPWIDFHRMGIQGHSFGGFETNYIVSHSSLFAAAAPASGISNEISNYGETGVTWFFERRQARIGASLWERPDLYIENSAVLKADKVSAAVLIMHTTNDYYVPYSQGMQWYNVLHRLKKKVWLLSYDGEDHTLNDEVNQLDYSIRLGQFFDYYLKGSPPPKWMTIGVPPNMKGKDDGLELDMSGKRP